MQSALTQTFRLGQSVGPYRIEGLLGAGGMGRVYLAHDRVLGRSVAIKVVDPAKHDGTALHLLMREARLAAALDHPSICGVHEVGRLGDEPFIVMEHVKGLPLSTVLESRQPLAFETALHYQLQITDGAAHAHDQGIVHGDLKASNVMITPDGRAVILDFGLAVQRPAGARIDAARIQTTAPVSTSGCAGTVPYMAPELLRGREADVASDIWALGVLFFEMLSGDRPFKGATTYELAAAILASEPPPVYPRVPPGVRRVITRCLSARPADRYRSARELAAALDEL